MVKKVEIQLLTFFQHCTLSITCLSAYYKLLWLQVYIIGTLNCLVVTNINISRNVSHCKLDAWDLKANCVCSVLRHAYVYRKGDHVCHYSVTLIVPMV